MGAEDGDPDERPVHPVRLGDFWLADTPLSWEAECRLMGWEPPPQGLPENYGELSALAYRQDRHSWFAHLWGRNRIRLQYCEDETTQAQDWHAHEPEARWTGASGEQVDASELFGDVPRAHPERPSGYTQKPVVPVAWEEAVAVGEHISTPQIIYRLPTEAEWEKAARGALIGKRYPWGDGLPSVGRCDRAALRVPRVPWDWDAECYPRG